MGKRRDRRGPSYAERIAKLAAEHTAAIDAQDFMKAGATERMIAQLERMALARAGR